MVRRIVDIASVGVAPLEPIPVGPGETIGATVGYKNKGLIPGTFIWRLQLNPEGGVHGWDAGTEADWQTNADLPAGAGAQVIITRAIPSNWGAGKIFGKVDARTATVGWKDIEVPTEPIWEIQTPSPDWIELIANIEYFAR